MSECMSCGGFVSDDYARVFGDNQNNVFDCRSCRTDRRRSDKKKEDDDGEQVLLRSVRGADEAYSAGRGRPRSTAEDDTTASTTDGDGAVESAWADQPSGDTDSQSGLDRVLSVFRA